MANIEYDKRTAIIISNIENEAKRTVRELRELAVSIRDNMNDLINKLDQDGIDARINTVGEIQNAGPELDRLCGELKVYRDTLTLLRTLALT